MSTPAMTPSQDNDLANQKAQAAIEATVTNGARWANNIIVELLGNYGLCIDEMSRDALRAATAALSGINVKPRQPTSARPKS